MNHDELDDTQPYAAWREDKDASRVGDPPRLRYTQPMPTTPNSDSNGLPWCEACHEGFFRECYCTFCKGIDPKLRGKHAGCYCWLNRQMRGTP